MSMTKINWYPGHMYKTKNMITENLKLVDIVFEIVDARIPISSKNPDISRLAKDKKRVILLNKSDLIENSELDMWSKYFKENNFADEVIAVSSQTGNNFPRIFKMVDRMLTEKKERMLKKGIKNTAVRIMVAGIPNVGKSKLINRIVGKRAAGVGNMPGFTRGKQWVRIKEGMELLDTPGILWPKFESDDVGYSLAITGSINDDILDMEDIASKFIEIMKIKGKTAGFIKKYGLKEEEIEKEPYYIIENVAKKLGMVQKNGVYNMKNAAFQILKDYRSGKIGKFGVDSIITE